MATNKLEVLAACLAPMNKIEQMDSVVQPQWKYKVGLTTPYCLVKNAKLAVKDG